MSAAENGACMQNATARARATDAGRQLQLVHAASAEARLQPDARPMEAGPALAVWRLQRLNRTTPLPRELARRAISHYTDPGDLVLAPPRGAGAILEQAARLGRRALPLEPSASGAGTGSRAGAGVPETVVPLRPGEGAALVLAQIRARAGERLLSRLAATLLPLLRPGGFLALALGPGANRSDVLGAIVRACQESGLQYWQHVVALTPLADSSEGARSQTARVSAGQPSSGRAARCHHDVLVFRRPAHADAVPAAAAAVERVAA
jgi:hypothetical protein